MTTSFRRTSLCLGTTLLATTLAAAAPPSDDELTDAIEQAVQDALDMPGAVGLSVAVAIDGRMIVDDGYGIAELEHDVAADKSTMFRIASITKQFSAAAIMGLVEDGMLSLDASIDAYFPDYPFDGRTVTVRQLLNHTSGIPGYTEVGTFWQTGVTRELTTDELLDYVDELPFDFEPGEQMKYNNTAYYMLGPIIEQVTGSAYTDYLQDEFFTPLNLDRTRYDSNRAMIRNRAQGYDFNSTTGEFFNDRLIGMDNPGAAGGILSTAGDLVRWQQALSTGKVVSTESYTLMTTPTVLPDGTDTGYGFGLEMRDIEERPNISHGGGIFGFNSMLTYYPATDDQPAIHIAVISNGAVNAGGLAQRLARIARGLEDNAPQDLAVDPDYAARCTGRFLLDHEQIQLEVEFTVKDGKLMVSPDGQGTFPMLYQGGREFRFAFDPSAKIIFDEDDSTNPLQTFTLYQGGMEIQANRIKE